MSSFNKYPHVFSPIKIGGMEVKNRVQFSPMVSSLSTPTGAVSPELLGYIKYQAQSGVGVITIGSTPINHTNGVDFFGALDVTSDDNMTDLRRISEIVHRYGAKISCELVHAGRSAPKQFRSNSPAIAPSAIPVENGPTDIREMDERDMETIRNEYCDVAQRLMKSGFDMVMVHAAHGNLLAQFLSPKYNQRTDEYGGSAENRARFAVDAVKAIRSRLPEIPIDYKLAVRQEDPHYGNAGVVESELGIFVPLLTDAGVTSFHVTLANHSSLEDTIPPAKHPYFKEQGCFLKFCDEVRQYTDKPITGVGGLNQPDFVEQQLTSGRITCAAMSRQLLADPEWPNKVASGQIKEIHRCVRCNKKCLGGLQQHQGTHCIYEKV